MAMFLIQTVDGYDPEKVLQFIREDMRQTAIQETINSPELVKALEAVKAFNQEGEPLTVAPVTAPDVQLDQPISNENIDGTTTTTEGESVRSDSSQGESGAGTEGSQPSDIPITEPTADGGTTIGDTGTDGGSPA